MRAYQVRYSWRLWLALCGVLLACEAASDKQEDAAIKEGDAAQAPMDASGDLPLSATLKGRVFDAETGRALKDAELKSTTGAVAKSDVDGKFELPVGDKSGQLAVSRPSYAPSSKAAPKEGGYVEVFLKDVDKTVEFKAEDGVSVKLESGASINLPPGAVRDAEGKRVTGEVTLEVSEVDGHKRMQASALPGEMKARDAGGKKGRAAVHGALELRIRDQKGTDLTVGKDDKVVAELPIREDKAAAERKVFSFDEKKGEWAEEGKAKRADKGDGKAVYQLEIKHLSWWSYADFFSELTCLQSCVEDGDGKVVAGAQIWVVGASHPGVASMFADESGCAADDVIAGAEVVLVAQAEAGISKALGHVTTSEIHLVKDGVSACQGTDVLTIGAESPSECAHGFSACAGVCSELATDGAHCGACGRACAAGQACVAGVCADGMNGRDDAGMPMADAGAEMDGAIVLPDDGGACVRPLPVLAGVHCGRGIRTCLSNASEFNSLIDAISCGGEEPTPPNGTDELGGSFDCEDCLRVYLFDCAHESGCGAQVDAVYCCAQANGCRDQSCILTMCRQELTAVDDCVPNACFGNLSNNLCVDPTASDTDGDGVVDDLDNCDLVANADQLDSDDDAEGDECDLDDDSDGVVDELDNCPLVPNATQADADADGVGGACDLCPLDAGTSTEDVDGDGIGDGCDNCPEYANGDQNPSACLDPDQDLIVSGFDSCPSVFNEDSDADRDGIDDNCDNCFYVANHDQVSADDEQGDVCACPVNPQQVEICGNGIDDNCSGLIDEGCPGACSNGSRGEECDLGAAIDEDCDGLFNEGCDRPACNGSPAPEVCTTPGDPSVDEDCDGTADENCQPLDYGESCTRPLDFRLGDTLNGSLAGASDDNTSTCLAASSADRVYAFRVPAGGSQVTLQVTAASSVSWSVNVGACGGRTTLGCFAGDGTYRSNGPLAEGVYTLMFEGGATDTFSSTLLVE